MFRTSGRERQAGRKTHIRRNDQVIVLSGRDAGKKGKVLRVIPTKGTAIVERINFSKKHTKKNPQKNVQGGVLERESPINIDKLMVVCPSCSEPTRIGSHRTEEGSVRVCKNCEAELGK